MLQLSLGEQFCILLCIFSGQFMRECKIKRGYQKQKVSPKGQSILQTSPAVNHQVPSVCYESSHECKIICKFLLVPNLGLMLKDNAVLTFMAVDLSTLSNVSTTLLKLLAYGCFLGFLCAVEAATPVFYDLHPFVLNYTQLYTQLFYYMYFLSKQVSLQLKNSCGLFRMKCPNTTKKQLWPRFWLTKVKICHWLVSNIHIYTDIIVYQECSVLVPFDMQ